MHHEHASVVCFLPVSLYHQRIVSCGLHGRRHCPPAPPRPRVDHVLYPDAMSATHSSGVVSVGLAARRTIDRDHHSVRLILSKAGGMSAPSIPLTATRPTLLPGSIVHPHAQHFGDVVHRSSVGNEAHAHNESGWSHPYICSIAREYEGRSGPLPGCQWAR